MSRLKLALRISNTAMAWYVEAAEDKKITPEEGADLLRRIAAILGLEQRLHVGVEPVE